MLFAAIAGPMGAVVLLQDRWPRARGRQRVVLGLVVAVLFLPVAGCVGAVGVKGAYNHCEGEWLAQDQRIVEGTSIRGTTGDHTVTGGPRFRAWPPGFDCRG